MFDSLSKEAFCTHYPDAPATLRHQLGDHALLSIEQLAEFAARLDESSIEYNTGDLPVGHDPEKTPANGLSPEESIRNIAERSAWVVLKNIEQDPAYRALMEDCLDQIATFDQKRKRQMFKPQGFIFISSPGAVTPFHIDPEHNILMQARGSKTIHVIAQNAANILSPEQHEAFHGAGGHRNLPHRKSHEMLATRFDLAPGDALYVPVKAPHWVKVGEEASVSLSVTWRSTTSEKEARLYQTNAWLRSKGAMPPAPGNAPLRDQLKVFAHRAAARLAGNAAVAKVR